MARKKATTPDPLDEAPKRTRTKRVKPTDGSFALKLRVEGVRDEHREALATKQGVSKRKITRAALKDWLLERAHDALNTLYVAGPAAHSNSQTAADLDAEDDDLLG